MQKKFLLLFLAMLAANLILSCSGKKGPKEQVSANNRGEVPDNITIVLGHAGTVSDSNHLHQYSMKFKEEMGLLRATCVV